MEFKNNTLKFYETYILFKKIILNEYVLHLEL